MISGCKPTPQTCRRVRAFVLKGEGGCSALQTDVPWTWRTPGTSGDERARCRGGHTAKIKKFA